MAMAGRNSWYVERPEDIAANLLRQLQGLMSQLRTRPTLGAIPADVFALLIS